MGRWLTPALVTLVALAAAVPAQAAPARPLGAALWFTCTQAEPIGPPELACPRAFDARYAETAVRAFDRFTPENEMKMAYLQPERGRYDFALLDRLLAFARDHGKTLRGHPLVWHDQLPGWVTQRVLPWPREELIGVLRSYVHDVVGHVRRTAPGVVTTWDVINEPLASDGRLRPNVWAKAIGPDYLRIALHAARDADPHARLVINDYDVDWPGNKSNGLVHLASDLRRAGAPLDGVGIQGHMTVRNAPTQEELETLFARFARLDVEVEVTELDVTGGTADERAEVFGRYARACGAAPNCKGLTVWGVADDYSWQGGASRALLYDSHFQAKPVAQIVRQGLAPARTKAKPRKAQARAKSRPARSTRRRKK